MVLLVLLINALNDENIFIISKTCNNGIGKQARVFFLCSRLRLIFKILFKPFAIYYISKSYKPV